MKIKLIQKTEKPTPKFPGVYKSISGIDVLVLAFDEQSGIALQDSTTFDAGSFSNTWIPFTDRKEWEYVGDPDLTIVIK